MKTFDPNRIVGSLYGGKDPAPKDIRSSLKNTGLKFPVNIVAIELEHRDPKTFTFSSRKLTTWVIDSNRGMLYIVYNGPTEDLEGLCDQQSLLYGTSLLCETAGQWIDVLRRSVHSVRHRYLSRLSAINPEQFTLADEQECRAIALRALQHEPNWMESVQHWLNITLVQNENYLYELRRKCVEFISAATSNVNKSDIVSYLYVRALQEITQSYGFSDFRTIIPLILADLQPHIILDSTRILSEHGYSEPVQKALAFIRKSYAAPISVSEISSESFVTREHLSRLFKKETGYAVTEFLQLLRVGHAKKLLTETNTGVLEIALDSGFSTVEHFHRIFKKHTHLTPHRYRKMQ